jgi:hypothetical protein
MLRVFRNKATGHETIIEDGSVSESAVEALHKATDKELTRLSADIALAHRRIDSLRDAAIRHSDDDRKWRDALVVRLNVHMGRLDALEHPAQPPHETIWNKLNVHSAEIADLTTRQRTTVQTVNDNALAAFQTQGKVHQIEKRVVNLEAKPPLTWITNRPAKLETLVSGTDYGRSIKLEPPESKIIGCKLEPSFEYPGWCKVSYGGVFSGYCRAPGGPL